MRADIAHDVVRGDLFASRQAMHHGDGEDAAAGIITNSTNGSHRTPVQNRLLFQDALITFDLP
jgi:hypothetical protein